MNISYKKGISAPFTTLAGTLTDQPWNSYLLGQGINAMTGLLSDSALIDFELSSFPSFTQRQSFSTISSEDQYESAFSAEASGAYNMGSVKLSASSSYLSNVSYSETSMTIIATYEIVSDGYGTPNVTVDFTDEARQVAQDDPKRFRELYGDYYVASAVVGAKFVATYTCSASSSEALQEFKASIEGSTDIFSASGATSFSSKASAKHISVKCSIFMEGTNKLAPNFGSTPESVPNALDWFVAVDEDGKQVNLEWVPQRALLRNYSQLMPSLPNTLPIDPIVFARVQTLGFRIEQVKTLLNTLPVYFQTATCSTGETYAAAVQSLVNQYSASQALLPSNPDLVTSLAGLATSLTIALQPNVAIVAFYTSLIENPPVEGTSGNDQTQSFGFTGAPGGVSLTIYSSTHIIQKSWHSCYWSIDVEWPWESFGTGDPLIVGWQVKDFWTDGTGGSWKRESGPMIGANTGKVQFNSEFDRGLHWALTVYYIKQSELPWL